MVGLALAAGCTTTYESAPPGVDGAIIHQAPATDAWHIVVDGVAAGVLVRFEEPDTARFLYSVRNEHNQDLGLIDADGRAFRFRPHGEPEWISTGTVLEGALEILGASAGELAPVPLTELRGVSGDER
ncbi:MAG: hypothetical protein GY711_12395 [bacterium]|nr:hypothetical protein [bacterium]